MKIKMNDGGGGGGELSNILNQTNQTLIRPSTYISKEDLIIIMKRKLQWMNKQI